MESALLTKDELLHKISSNASWENAYSRLSKEWQNKFLNFYSGTGTLPLTYDPFFKKYLIQKCILKDFPAFFP